MAISPIAKKLQIKPGMRIMVVNAPEGYFQQLEPLPEGAALVPSGANLDVVQLFVKDADQLDQEVARAANAVKAGGLLWVCYLKGGEKAGTDLNRDILHDKMEHNHQQIGVSLISIDDRWSAMRFKPA
jgi:hypothetical protein